MKLLNALKEWLRKPGNTEARLAVLLGYRDAAPIKAWIRRKKIPVFQAERVATIINHKET